MSAEKLMDFRGFMVDLALAIEIKREGCYYNFVMQSIIYYNYSSPTHGLERLIRR